MPQSRMTRGFTLIELLVVISIIAILIAILMPSLQKARERARVVACLSNVRTITFGMHMYAQDQVGWLPYAYSLGSFTAAQAVAIGETPNDAQYWDRLGAPEPTRWNPTYSRWEGFNGPNSYVPYDRKKVRGNSVWICPFSEQQAPSPHWYYQDRWSAQYSMNRDLCGLKQGATFGWPTLQMKKLTSTASTDTILVGDGNCSAFFGGTNGGYYFGSVIKGDTTAMPWPISPITLKPVSHGGVVNVGCADGHAESLNEPWGTTAMVNRFK